jgi:cupin fold WbuC family metalloprotein
MPKMDAKQISTEVFVANSAIIEVTRDDLEVLKSNARQSDKGKCRLLLHQTSNSSLHEMVIVHTAGKYIRPHKNVSSSKSFRILEGAFCLVLFGDDGIVEDMRIIGGDLSSSAVAIRLSDHRFHTLINLTEQVVFIETCLGPFTGSTYADWAPEEGESQEASAYFGELCRLIETDPNLSIESVPGRPILAK